MKTSYDVTLRGLDLLVRGRYTPESLAPRHRGEQALEPDEASLFDVDSIAPRQHPHLELLDLFGEHGITEIERAVLEQIEGRP